MNNILVILGFVAIVGFVFFIVKKNKRDQKDFENEINEKEIRPNKHDSDKI